MSSAAGLAMRPFVHELRDVATVSPTDRERLATMIRHRQPFLAKGLIRSWPLVEELEGAGSVDDEVEVFKALLGDTAIRYTRTPPEQHGDIGLADDLGANFKLDDRVESSG